MGQNMNDKFFLHVDLDAFFASVEQLDNPNLKGKPVIVGGLPTDKRSVVSTCSYEARKYGVHSAMPIAKAYQLCPNGIYLRGRMNRYQQKSHEVMNILKEFSPDFQQMSIDEAFIDLSGTERLFGNPKDTAVKIKKEVFERTGLTISVGMAPNKYLAKIASGMNKPNGEYFIFAGEEEKFMLSLPLKDVWGLGTKTLTKLNKLGIKTTKELHNLSKELLSTLFSPCTANFLYESVRGLNVKDFDTEPKNKSISSEHTFCIDLTDYYTIETALMNLSTDVFFRLLNEGLNGKTIALKIRYEDFTTVSIQETFNSFLSSSDDLYDKAKKIFYKKYESPRGIRLLGVSVQNLQNNCSVEEELFDFNNNKKKQAVEKAVLELQKKNPKAKISKARLLIKNIIFYFLFIFSFNFLFLQENSSINFTLPLLEELKPESPKSLFNYTKEDKNVEFFAEGFWESKLHSGISIQNKNKETYFNFITPVFEQQVDLSLWFLLNKKFYFETTFSDDFDNSTISAGYYNTGFLKHLRIGNNGITFPEYYDTDLLNSNNTKSPGISFNFAGNTWNSDIIIKYDSLENYEKIFSGNAELSESTIELSAWEKGRRFVIPSDIITDIEYIYVEDENGSYKDEQGKLYTRLNKSQYLIKPNQNLLFLHKKFSGNIAISFFSDASITSFNLSINDFIEDTKKLFYNSQIHNIEDYLSKNYFCKIENKTSILIQEEPFFSPFVLADYYNIGNSSYKEALLISKSTKKRINDFYVYVFSDDANFTQTDYINYAQTYAKISLTENNAQNTNYLLAKNRYPLANELPYIYLQNNYDTDFAISLRSFLQTTNYDIGQDATFVRVYKNGILDPTAKYNPKTGQIDFLTKPTEFDRIKITYQKNSNKSDSGAITTAIGSRFILNNNSNIQANIITKLNYSPYKKYSTPENLNPGYLSASTKYQYKNQNAEISNTITANLTLPDSSDLLKIYDTNDIEDTTNYLSINSLVKLSDNIIPKLNTISPIILDEKAKQDFIILNMQKDNNISGYCIEANWLFHKENQWNAFNIDLSSSGTSLASANEFSIALRNINQNSIFTTDYDIYLQLGVKADDKTYFENTSSIPTWKISKTPDEENYNNVISAFDTTSDTNWQTVTIKLTDVDKSRFINNTDARIIIIARNNIQSKENGLRVGPFEITQNDFTLTTQTNLSKTEKYISEINLNDYQKIKINFDLPIYQDLLNTPNIKFIFDKPKSLSNFETTLSIDISKETIYELSKKTTSHILIFNTKDKSVYIDDKKINTNIFFNPNITSTHFYIQADKQIQNPNELPSIKKIYLEDCKSTIDVKDKLILTLQKNDTFLKIKNIPILSNAKLNSETTYNYSLTQNKPFWNTLAKSSIDILGINFYTQFQKNQKDNSSITNYSNNYFSSVSHNIQTTAQNFIFKYIIFNEQFNIDRENDFSQKNNYFSLILPSKKIDSKIIFNTNEIYENEILRQKINGEFIFNIPNNKIEYTLNTKIDAEERQNNNNIIDINNKNYFYSYLDFTKLQYSTGSQNAQERFEKIIIEQKFNLKKINFVPTITVEALNNYIASNSNNIQNQNTIIVQLPFKIKDNSFSFSWQKQSKTSQLDKINNSYKSDLSNYFNNLNNQKWFFTIYPFYDIISKKLTKQIADNNFTNDQLSYNSTYTLSWQRALYANPMQNFFIPQSLTFIAARDIINSINGNTTDTVQFRTSLTHIALNCFGKFSKLKLFNWYEQDEFLSNILINLKYTDSFNFFDSYLISAYTTSSFFITNINTLQNVFEAQFSNKDEWNLKTSFIWNRNIPSSIFINMIKSIFKKLNKYKIFLYRKNILFYQITCLDNLKNNFGLQHELETNYNDMITISTGLNLESIIENNNTIGFELSATLKGKATF